MTWHRSVRTAYWLLVAALFAAQAAYTRAGLQRLWYEELAEGVRNPFWLDHRLVYDGVSSNVGWYGLVLLVDKSVGFSPYAAKYVRLALDVPFLVCAAMLLERCVGLARAWLALLAVGLSPTILYFNNLATSYGTDIQLFPVVLLLIVTAEDRAAAGRHAAAGIASIAAGAVAMVACLMFPAFLVYVPVLAAFAMWRLWPSTSTPQVFVHGLQAAAGFAAPFAIAVAYIANRRTFLADPMMPGSGVFRGGGQALTMDAIDIDNALSHLLRDLFVHGSSYYFDLPYVEFSRTLGFAAAAGIVLAAIAAGWKWPATRIPLLFAAAVCLAGIAAPAMARNLPGLRRSTAFVAGFYVIVACLCAVAAESTRGRVAAWCMRLVCLMLVVHHLVVYVPNYRYLQTTTAAMQDTWFYRFGAPHESVATWARDWVLGGRPLSCTAELPCRYSEIYAAVAAYLQSNGLGEPAVLATDPASGRVVTLTPEVFTARTLAH